MHCTQNNWDACLIIVIQAALELKVIEYAVHYYTRVGLLEPGKDLNSREQANVNQCPMYLYFNGLYR